MSILPLAGCHALTLLEAAKQGSDTAESGLLRHLIQSVIGRTEDLLCPLNPLLGNVGGPLLSLDASESLRHLHGGYLKMLCDRCHIQIAVRNILLYVQHDPVT